MSAEPAKSSHSTPDDVYYLSNRSVTLLYSAHPAFKKYQSEAPFQTNY